MELHHQGEKRKRIMDYTRRDARRAVADIAAQVAPWQTALVLVTARAQRPLTEDARHALAAECKEIGEAVAAARTTLIVRLMDASQKINADSRVVDMEKALDNVELQLHRARTALAKGLDG